jgi:hypothetical protein
MVPRATRLSDVLIMILLMAVALMLIGCAATAMGEITIAVIMFTGGVILTGVFCLDHRWRRR